MNDSKKFRASYRFYEQTGSKLCLVFSRYFLSTISLVVYLQIWSKHKYVVFTKRIYLIYSCARDRLLLIIQFALFFWWNNTINRRNHATQKFFCILVSTTAYPHSLYFLDSFQPSNNLCPLSFFLFCYGKEFSHWLSSVFCT